MMSLRMALNGSELWPDATVSTAGLLVVERDWLAPATAAVPDVDGGRGRDRAVDAGKGQCEPETGDRQQPRGMVDE